MNNIVTSCFDVGKPVFIRREQDNGHKLSFRWQRPRRVTRILGDLVYQVASLTDNKLECVHATRTMIYLSDMDGREISADTLEHAKHIGTAFDIVDELQNISEGDAGILIQVKWLEQSGRMYVVIPVSFLLRFINKFPEELNLF